MIFYFTMGRHRIVSFALVRFGTFLRQKLLWETEGKKERKSTPQNSASSCTAEALGDR